MDLKHLFIPITKVDAAQRLVYGLATAEVADKANEVCDYASTKPYYEKWSGEIAKATDGRSLGNLRVMHGNLAAGKITQLAFNDAARQIEICAKIVDDTEWKKVEEGVYTGFSQGGKYVQRWKDPANPALTRYTAEPVEVSLVDVPCLPSATFEMIKDDGTRERRLFKASAEGPIEARDGAPQSGEGTRDGETYEQVWQSRRDGRTFRKKAELIAHHHALDADAAAHAAAGPALEALAGLSAALVEDEGAALGKRDYSDAQRARYAQQGVAMADGSYPIPDRAALKDAIEANGRANNKRAVRRHIVRRAKALGASDMLPPEWIAGADHRAGGAGAPTDKALRSGALRKGASLEGVADLLQLLAAIECAEGCAESDDYFSGAVNLGKDIKDRFGALLVELGDIAAQMLDVVLGAMRREEAAEAVARAAPLTDLMKLGARNSKADLDRLNAIHDLTVELGVDCASRGAAGANDESAADDADTMSGKAAASGALAKARDELARTGAERDALRKVLSDLPASLEALKTSVDTLKAERDGLLKEIAARVKAIEEQPAVAPPRAGYVVNRDGTTEPLGAPRAAGTAATKAGLIDQVLETLDPQELALALIRKSHQNPQPVYGRGG